MEDGSTTRRACEVVQSLMVKGQQQPVAQVAFGSAAKGEAMRLTIVVPPAISLAKGVQVKAGDATLVELAWRRCLPGGCFADAVLSAETLRTMRNRAEPVQVTFRNASEQDGSLPVSLRGLSQALDALAKEDAAR